MTAPRRCARLPNLVKVETAVLVAFTTAPSAQRSTVLKKAETGEVSELADEHDLGSCAFGRRSSNLLFPTKGGRMPLRVQVSGLPPAVSCVKPNREGNAC